MTGFGPELVFIQKTVTGKFPQFFDECTDVVVEHAINVCIAKVLNFYGLQKEANETLNSVPDWCQKAIADTYKEYKGIV